MIIVQAERQASRNIECGICYEYIVESGRRFGILTGCDHSFCLSCIRGWRATNDSAKSTVRSCPLCRTQSHFIVPSDRLIDDVERKSRLNTSYQMEMSTIPCKYFNYGIGECPFGSSCFYSHLGRDGKPIVVTKGGRNLLREDGLIKKTNAINLSDFVVTKKKNRWHLCVIKYINLCTFQRTKQCLGSGSSHSPCSLESGK